MTPAPARTAEELFGPAGTPRVVVVGAGFGGIAAGVKLQHAGIHTFTIYESSLGVGGTWWDNTYPGAEVDVGSHLYSYSFKSHDWTRTHAQQAELQKYLEETVDEFGLRPHLRARGRGRVGDVGRRPPRVDGAPRRRPRRPSATCSSAAWASSTCRATPTGPGLDDFAGPQFHTSRWEHQHDLTGKVVAVVGTGSTATQIVPAIQPDVAHLYVFQREPGWVLPKGDRDFTPEERSTFANRWRRRRERLRLKWLMEKNIWGGKIFRPDSKINAARRQIVPRLHRPRPSTTAPTCATRSRRRTRTPASGRSSRRPSTRRSRSPTSSWCRARWRRSRPRASSTSTASSARSTSS